MNVRHNPLSTVILTAVVLDSLIIVTIMSSVVFTLQFFKNRMYQNSHVLNTSLLEFNVLPSLLYIMWYFSLRHTLHFFVTGLKSVARSFNFQLTSYCMCLSFRSQMCAARVDFILLLSLFISALCSYNLSLKVLAVTPV